MSVKKKGGEKIPWKYPGRQPAKKQFKKFCRDRAVAGYSHDGNGNKIPFNVAQSGSKSVKAGYKL